MKPEETLQLMADLYSDIFPTRRLAIHHLFLTVGNGADWVNGEIVYNDPKFHRYLFKEPVIKAIFSYKDDYIPPHVNSYRIYCKRHNVPFDEKQINAYLNTDYSSKYIMLNNYPNNITPEWKELLEECKNYIRKEGIVLPK